MDAMTGRTAIVGAGLSGLVIAGRLRDAGEEVRLFEKSRAAGGRIASRRTDVTAFDHGAQYFTARTPRFREIVARWHAEGVVLPWDGPFHTLNRGVLGPDPGSDQRWVGVPRMSSIARHLARGLDLETGTRISSIERDTRGWRLSTESGEVHDAFDRIIVATPAPQAVPLLTEQPDFADIASRARLAPCFALMVTFEDPLDVAFGGAFVERSALSWVARQSSKPERAAAPDYLLHATADWSATHRDDPHPQIQRALLAAFEDALAAPLPRAAFAAVHRWLYAVPITRLDEGCSWDASIGIGVCGDWMCGARVEGAVESGMTLADAVLAEPD